MAKTIDYLLIAKQELNNISINDYITEKSATILNEFLHFINKANTPNPYIKILNETIEKLQTIYKLEKSHILVITSTYDRGQWGRLYWNALHLMSILIQDAFYNGKIESMLKFPLILYNIDMILICSVCKSHYLAIKQNPEIKEIIELASYGFTINSVYLFHNIINKNIDKTNPAYGFIDFIYEYNINPLDSNSSGKNKVLTYAKVPVNFECRTNINIAILLTLYNKTSNIHFVSNCLKKLYGINNNDQEIVPYIPSDFTFYNLDATAINKQLNEILTTNWEPENNKLLYDKVKKQILNGK